jgi:hypothetical protein
MMMAIGTANFSVAEFAGFRADLDEQLDRRVRPPAR